MSSLSTNLQLIRQRLLEPDPSAPQQHILLNILLEKVADHTLQLGNTRQHWAVNHTTLTTSSGTEDYLITAADFGRPFLVYTTDASDPYHVRREVPFSLIQDTEYRYLGPQQYNSQLHSAVEISFYRTPVMAPAWYARPVPIPGGTVTYEIWYDCFYDPGSLEDTPGLSSFHHLIRCETALDALPGCAWGSVSLTENSNAWETKCKALALVLSNAIAKYQKQFNDYKAQSTREGVNQKLGMGRDYEQDFMPVGRMTNGYGW